MDLTSRFREQAEACRVIGSPMYAELLGRIAEDIEAGGASRTVLAGHEDDPGPSALALRLLGSVHRLVLEGRAGRLGAFYPSVGGTWELDGGWQAFAGLLRESPELVREWLDRPPQTNEVGRAAALMGGLLQLPRFKRDVRLFEIGCSAGLNLQADRFGYTDAEGRFFGDPGSPVVLRGAWAGRRLEPWPGLRIVERVGCDVMPVDVTTAQGRLTLTAYVWPDQTRRIERLQAALIVAQREPAEVRAQDAVGFVRGLELVPGTTTVLWHSVMWQYLTKDDQRAVEARIGELGSRATAEAGFAHLWAEPVRRVPDADFEFLVSVQVWPGGERRILGSSVAHGVPTTWQE